MSHAITLPALKCSARRNFCSSVIGACNRVFAIYQVDVADKPFWVMEMDHTTGYTMPLRGIERFASHVTAIDRLSEMAKSAMGVINSGDRAALGCDQDVYWPDTAALDDTFHRIEMAV